MEFAGAAMYALRVSSEEELDIDLWCIDASLDLQALDRGPVKV